MTYKATAAGVTILFQEGSDINWFIDMALAKGACIHIERLEQWQGESELVSTILPTN